MSYRDSEFQESLQAFQISSSLATKDHVPENKRLRIAIIQCVLAVVYSRSIPADMLPALVHRPEE